MRKSAYFDKTVSVEEFPCPSSNETQIQVIADIVNTPEGFDEYRKILKDEHFTDPECLAAYHGLCAAYDRGEGLSLISLRAIVGNQFLTQVIEKPASSLLESVAHCNSLAKISRRRSVYTSCLELLQAVSIGEGDPAKVSETIDKLQEAKGGVNDWKDAIFDYTATVNLPPPLLTCSGAPICTRENLTVITGRPKACKTTFQAGIIAACIAGKAVLNVESTARLKVLLCDTEQSEYYVFLECERVFRMAGLERRGYGDFAVLGLRRFDPPTRFEIISAAVESQKPDLLFIDGAADLILDPNDLPTSERLVSDLLTMAEKNKLGIITIVHSNPGGEGKVRGHLGSCLERKAESIITIEHNDRERYYEVKPRLVRNKPFDPFRFTINETRDPELVLPDNGPKTAEDWLLFLMEPGREYRNSELVAMLSKMSLKKSAIQYAIRAALQKGRMEQKGELYSLRLAQSSADDMPDI